MVAVPDTYVLRAFFSFAIGILLFAVSALLTFAGNQTPAKRVLALVLALSGANELFVTGYWLSAGPDSPIGAVWSEALVDLRLISQFAFVTFFWLYPARPRARSAHTLAFAACIALLLAAVVLRVAARDAFLTDADGSLRRTFLYDLALVSGPGVALTLMTASSLARVPVRDGGERPTALVLVPLLSAWLFVYFGLYAFEIVQTWGTATPAHERLFVLPPGDTLGLVVPLRFAVIGATVGMILWLAVRHRSFVAAGATAFGFLVSIPFALGISSIDFGSVISLFPALGTLFVVHRYGAFGLKRLPRTVDRLVAAMTLTIVFVAVNIVTVVALPGNAFALAVGIFLGIALGALAALAVLPKGLGGLLRARAEGEEATERRLGAYRAALRAALPAGDAPDALHANLRALREELGVSDQEHAVMVYLLRPDPARGDAAIAPGKLFLDRYRVRHMIGSGGLGSTYLCYDEAVKREVVLKSIRSPVSSPEGLQAVLAEAQAIGALRHPNVVTLHDIQQVGNRAFILMEHVAGGSLTERLVRGPLRRDEFERVARGLLDALAAVHDAGIVHRDVKPSNVLLTQEGEAKLADFGVAHVRGFESTVGGTDGAVGTVRFMSPEQAKGRRVTAASDLFSAAATLFEAWTGHAYLAPRDGESAMELQMRAARAAPFDRAIKGPPALRAWFAKALAPAPEERYPDAREMRVALDASFIEAESQR